MIDIREHGVGTGKKLVGNAIPSNVLAGKTFSNSTGNNNVGTMTNRSSTTVLSQDSYIDGTFLANRVYLKPPTGYYDGTNSLVYVDDTDFIASNIKSGINLFGLTGSLIALTTERKYATGTGTLNASGQLTVSGLAFQPSLVVIQVQSGNNKYRLVYHSSSNFSTSTYFSDTGWTWRDVNMYGHWSDISGNSVGTGQVTPIYSSDPSWSVNATGFTSSKISAPNQTAIWWAYQ